MRAHRYCYHRTTKTWSEYGEINISHTIHLGLSVPFKLEEGIHNVISQQPTLWFDNVEHITSNNALIAHNMFVQWCQAKMTRYVTVAGTVRSVSRQTVLHQTGNTSWIQHNKIAHSCADQDKTNPQKLQAQQSTPAHHKTSRHSKQHNLHQQARMSTSVCQHNKWRTSKQKGENWIWWAEMTFTQSHSHS